MRARWVAALLVPTAAVVVGAAACGASLGSTGSGGTGANSGGTVTPSGTGSGGDGLDVDAASPSTLGHACSSNADCGALECLGPASADVIFGGGPAGGLCTKPCTGPNDCAGADAVCYRGDDGQPGRCVLGCTLGPPLQGLHQVLDPSKCLGREDLRCAAVTGSAGVCLPTCGEDKPCGAGRVCDPRLAVCVTTPTTGLPEGTPCDAAAGVNLCAGQCVGFSSGAALCASPCVLGGGSLDTANCGGAAAGLCAFHPPESGPGDAGYCTPSCTSHAECLHPVFGCFSVPDYTDALGKGYCFAAVACPSGQSDCVDAGKNPLPYTCTATPQGPLCLDGAFPIGDGAGGGGGMGPADAGTDSAP